MIYTVTLNPSLDYIARVDDFQTGRVNRTSGEIICAGGKGINVSLVLKNLGVDSTALGFLAGFTGQEIKRRVEEQGVLTDFIEVEDGISRINVKLRSKEESEINGQGPETGDRHIRELCRKLEGLRSGDVLVLAGSIPSSLPDGIYRDIMKMLSDKGIKIAVDATGQLLLNVLPYRPFLVKPNHHELGEIFGVTFSDRKEVVTYAKKLQDMGAENVLVSMAGLGAVLVTGEGDVYESRAPKGEVVNSVGAGDSMVAGFLAGYLLTGDYRTAFKYGISAGSASAFSERLATRREIDAVMNGHAFEF